MVIKNFEVADTQARLAIIEIYIDCAVRYPNHPENVVRVDVHVEVVNLLGKVGRSDRTGVQVKSDKSESALVVPSIGADELALAETHVRLEGQLRRGVGESIRSGSATANVCQSDESVEIGDL